VSFPEFFVLRESLADTRCEKHGTGEVSLDNAFVLIEGHPEPKTANLRKKLGLPASTLDYFDRVAVKSRLSSPPPNVSFRVSPVSVALN